MLPLRLLLVRKSLHTNLLILAAKQAVENPSLIFHPFPDAQVLALVHHLFARLDRDSAVARNGLCRRERGLYTLLGRREHPRRKSPIIRILSAEVLSRENQLHRTALADRTRQTLRATRARDDAQLDLRLAEVGFRRAVEDVAHHGQLAASTQRVSVDRRDDGLLDGVGEVTPGLDKVVPVGLREGLGAHFFDVGAGREGFVRAGQDRGADGGVLVKSAESGIELEDERGEKGIERLGAVELN
nr:hypothetical protein CFP56_70773 [Quercus suber]